MPTRLSRSEIRKIIEILRDPRPHIVSTGTPAYRLAEWYAAATSKLSERAANLSVSLAAWTLVRREVDGLLEARKLVNSRTFRRYAKFIPPLEDLRASIAEGAGATRPFQPATHFARDLARNGFTRTEIGQVLQEMKMLRVRIDPDDPGDLEPARVSVQKRLRSRSK